MAVTIERPFIAVTVENVWERPEPLPLLAVVTGGKALGIRPPTRGFQFDIADKHFVEMHCEVGAAESAGQERFASADDSPAEGAASASHKLFEGSAQLVFRLAMRQLRHLCSHICREGLKSVLDRYCLSHVFLF